MNLCVIPARGGSKRVPRKNIREFAGKPMIAWSIEAACSSRLFDHVVVSTEDPEVAEVAKSFGAEVPFVRPKELADDFIATRPVLNHAIVTCQELFGVADFVCCLYPTAPFLFSSDLRQAFELLTSPGIDFVLSAATFAYPIQRGFRRLGDNGLERLYPQFRNTRSQDLEEVYHDAGQFYWGRNHAFLENRDSISERGRIYVLPRFRVHDIDTEEDWKRAETVFLALYSEGKPE